MPSGSTVRTLWNLTIIAALGIVYVTALSVLTIAHWIGHGIDRIRTAAGFPRLTTGRRTEPQDVAVVSDAEN